MGEQECNNNGEGDGFVHFPDRQQAVMSAVNAAQLTGEW
jgi:hypothetical protein